MAGGGGIYGREWFNDASFWERFAPVMFDNARWDEVSGVADGLTSLAGLDLFRGAAGPPRCLDQCCGFGRIGLEMARRGFSVTGVDITKSYLQTAREDAACENLDIELVEDDVRSFSREGFFDLAYNVYISFGYFADPAHDALTAGNAFHSLKSGGRYAVETLGLELAARDFVEAEWFERGGYFVMTSYRAAASWTALTNRWIIVNQIDRPGGPLRGEIAEKTFTQRLYSAAALEALFRAAGFTAVRSLGGWDGRPYDERALTLITAGTRP